VRGPHQEVTGRHWLISFLDATAAHEFDHSRSQGAGVPLHGPCGKLEALGNDHRIGISSIAL
jgi:hypothetical protein